MRFVKIFKFGLLLLLLIANICLASSAPVDIKLNVKEFQLENGMLFLVVERPATPQVAVRLAIRAGSALEETGRTGIAHLLAISGLHVGTVAAVAYGGFKWLLSWLPFCLRRAWTRGRVSSCGT